MTLRMTTLSLVLLLTGVAGAQNYAITLHDQQNGNGNVIWTYTGPMLSAGLNYVTISGFVLNPGALSWTTPPPSNQDTAGTFNPCAAQTINNGADAVLGCYANFLPSGVPLFTFCFQGTQWPIPVGTYNVDSQNPGYCGNYFVASAQIAGYNAYAYVNGGSIVVSQATPTYSCQGFQTPFGTPISIKSNTQRAIPLKAQIFDASGNLVTPTVLGSASAPVVTVTYTAVNGTGVNVTNELDPLGLSSSGNVFNFDSTSNTWWFNLATSPFTASGTYTVSLQSGDVNQYSVSPQCSGTFVRQ